MPAKAKEPKPPAPPKAAIKTLAALHDESLALWQSTVRPWMVQMETWDSDHGRPVSAGRREALRDEMTNRLHESHLETRQLRDRVLDGALLAPQAPPCDERDEG
jgi:hypothetical protein